MTWGTAGGITPARPWPLGVVTALALLAGVLVLLGYHANRGAGLWGLSPSAVAGLTVAASILFLGILGVSYWRARQPSGE